MRFLGVSHRRVLSEALEALAAAGVRVASTNVRDRDGEVMLDLGLSAKDEVTGEAVMAALGYRVDRATA